MSALPEYVEDLRELPESLREYYAIDAAGERYHLQTARSPRPIKPIKNMTVREKVETLKELGLERFARLL